MSGAFDTLDSTVKELAVSRFGKPTRQEEAIPKIMEGKNVLVIAPTGMGKTESCLTPVLSKLVSQENQPIAALYLTLSRASQGPS
jgi:ATP-dependent Lhr-like helicase